MNAVYEALLSRLGEANPQPRLAPSARLADLLGHPEASAPVIHITGTNGKTSTARMIEGLLRAAGLRTGLLISPHLESFTERIQLDGEPISDDAVERNWDEIQPMLQLVDDELVQSGELPLTFFEALTALAFACFADAPVDVMIIEVGMGGAWDSTNIVSSDVAVFAPIGLDHLGRIGNSLAEIASTKAGIINADSIVVTAQQDPVALDAILGAAQAAQVEVKAAPQDFGLVDTRIAVGGQLLNLRDLSGGERSEVFLPLFGAHQAANASLALAAVEAFFGGAANRLGDDLVSEGFALATSPGRLEVVGIAPTVVVDGAHNPHGIRAVAQTLAETFGERDWAVVLGVLHEKDARGFLHELGALQPTLFITSSSSDRAVDASELESLALAEGLTVQSVAAPAAALTHAREWAAGAENRAVLVTGSLTLVADAIAIARSENWMRP
ncbi:MAG: bifunctional folylpolyglutamate synthase/dihydrofolate synthase [Microbacteriaceae bacterium]